MRYYEYSGLVYRKRKQDVINKLVHSRRIKAKNIKSVSFNKRKVKGSWKFKAIVQRK